MKKIILIFLSAIILSFCACAQEKRISQTDSTKATESMVTSESTVADSGNDTVEIPISTESDSSIDTENIPTPDTVSAPETIFTPVTDPPSEATEPDPSITEEIQATEMTATVTEPPEESKAPEEVIYIDDPDEDDDYKDIPNKGGGSVKNHMFSLKDSEITLKFTFPSNWQLTQNESGGYTVSLEKEIGSFFKGSANDSDIWKTVDTVSVNSKSLSIERNIEKFGAGEGLRFRYRYVYSLKEKGEDKIMTLTLDYARVFSNIADKLLNNVIQESLYSDPKFGSLEHLADGSILIVGNSFIRTSSIGNILFEMIQSNGKKLRINALSQGYAKVGTYTASSSVMSDIKSGKYDAVFMCGLYSADEIANVKVLKDACDNSETDLIIFPAHNENRSVIESAVDSFPNLTLLDWKAEIDMFINHGADKWDFCQNDSHKHSTPLAGYIGSHMIYRAIYGEVPHAKITSSINQGTIESKLGDYVELGYITVTDKSDVIYVG